MPSHRLIATVEWGLIAAYAVALLTACAYVIGGRNPFVVAPLPERPCNGVYSSDSLEVCRDTVTR